MYKVLNPQTGKLEYHEGEKPRKTPKPIPKISKRKKMRIATFWSETDKFMEIWNERPHECEECQKPLFTPRPHNFDHEIPKSRGEEFRYDKDDIRIKCFWCHYTKTTWQIYKGIDLDLP